MLKALISLSGIYKNKNTVKDKVLIKRQKISSFIFKNIITCLKSDQKR